MKILSVGIVLGALFTLTPAASPDYYNAEVASKYCQYQLLLYNDTTVTLPCRNSLLRLQRECIQAG